MTFPRVTEILKPFTNYDKVPNDILEKASVRGTIVHGVCAGIARGEWIEDELIEDSYKGYIKSFRMWQEQQVKRFVLIETRYEHDELRFSGQLDCVIQGNDNKFYLVDFKTSASPQKTYPVQMAAYEALLKRQNFNIDGAYIVYLSKDGTFPDIDFLEDLSNEFSVFVSALECWNYFKKGKRNARAAA